MSSFTSSSESEIMNTKQIGIYFCSDPHFGHANIIKYCNRPFKNVEEMDEALIKNWNDKVKSEDTIYITGDVFFHQEAKAIEILSRLNGKKILIYGNHDKPIKRSKTLQSMFEKCCDYEEIWIGDQFIVMSHYAMIVWNKSHRGSFMIHGHSHGGLKYPIEGKILDVGIDAHNYAPISYEKVKSILDKKITQPVDHL